MDSHLEHAETGLETLNRGVSATLGLIRGMTPSMRIPNFGCRVQESKCSLRDHTALNYHLRWIMEYAEQ